MARCGLSLVPPGWNGRWPHKPGGTKATYLDSKRRGRRKNSGVQAGLPGLRGTQPERRVSQSRLNHRLPLNGSAGSSRRRNTGWHCRVDASASLKSTLLAHARSQRIVDDNLSALINNSANSNQAVYVWPVNAEQEGLPTAWRSARWDLVDQDPTQVFGISIQRATVFTGDRDTLARRVGKH